MSNATISIMDMKAIRRIELDAAELRGSEKQVAWAQDLRGKKINDIYNLPWQNDEQRQAVVAHLCGIQSAKWWIENARMTAAPLMAKEAAQEIGLI